MTRSCAGWSSASLWPRLVVAKSLYLAEFFLNNTFMRRLLLLLSVCLAGVAQAQKIPDPRPFAKTITAADLKKHLYIVASADFEGRETATEGQRKAAAYIENDFRSLGLQPGGGGGNFKLFYPLFQDWLELTTLRVNSHTLSTRLGGILT